MKRAHLLLVLFALLAGAAGCRSAIRGGEHDGEYLLAWPRTAVRGAEIEWTIFELDDPIDGIADEWRRTVTLDAVRRGAEIERTLIREEF